jgi:hypothetical protein
MRGNGEKGMKPVFAGAREIFPTLHILASLPGKNSRFALKPFSRRALHCGGTVPQKISDGAPMRSRVFMLR